MPVLASAQSWCPPGAAWKYSAGETNTECLPSQALRFYAGDTLVDGYPAQRIDQSTQVVWQGTVTAGTGFFGVTRTDGDVVWEWSGSSWDTLYWFSAGPGDHWQPFWLEDGAQGCPDHAWFVLDTFTTVMDGVPLRSMHAEIRENGVSTGISSTFIERIGIQSGYSGEAPCGGVFECAWGFVCYMDNEIGASNPCELTLGVPSASMSTEALAWPNPSNGAVSVTWPGHSRYSIQLHDASGRRILEWPPARSVVSMNLESLQRGLYELVLVDPEGNMTVLRLQKE
jgi:hypothetical protein